MPNNTNKNLKSDERETLGYNIRICITVSISQCLLGKYQK